MREARCGDSEPEQGEEGFHVQWYPDKGYQSPSRGKKITTAGQSWKWSWETGYILGS